MKLYTEEKFYTVVALDDWEFLIASWSPNLNSSISKLVYLYLGLFTKAVLCSRTGCQEHLPFYKICKSLLCISWSLRVKRKLLYLYCRVFWIRSTERKGGKIQTFLFKKVVRGCMHVSCFNQIPSLSFS